MNDNKCFKQRIDKYLSPTDDNPRITQKAEKYFAKKLNFRDIFILKIRDIHKIGKRCSIDIRVFGYENKENHPIYVSKNCCEEKHVDLLLRGEKGKIHYVLIKDFDTVMYDHTLHCGRKHFCRYCLQVFNKEDILKCHIKNCFKINGKQRIIMPKNVNMLNSKNIKEE